MSTLKQRMYHLTMYNISEIQKGIQSYHAGMQYALGYWNTPEFQRWANHDKTVIILNGGTSNNIMHDGFEPTEKGTMEKAIDDLDGADIPFATFCEPDLNNSTSGIAFLCNEKVWDKETYIDAFVMPEASWDELSKDDRRAKMKERYDKTMVEMYGAKVAFLREWLKQFRLA